MPTTKQYVNNLLVKILSDDQVLKTRFFLPANKLTLSKNDGVDPPTGYKGDWRRSDRTKWI